MSDKIDDLDQCCATSNLGSYMHHIDAIENISLEEEADLLQKIYEGSQYARDKLVMAHMRLVHSIARQHSGYGLPLDDLIQEGAIGLMRALENYDSSTGARYNTYARHWVLSCIREYVIRNIRIVRIATTKSQRKLFYKLSQHRTTDTWMKPDVADEVACLYDVDIKDVYQMEARLRSRDSPYEESSKNTHEAPKSVSSNPEIALEESDMAQKVRETVDTVMKTLSDRHREIMERRWIGDRNAESTLKQIGNELGLSPERIRQLEADALYTIQEAMEKSGIKESQP